MASLRISLPLLLLLLSISANHYLTTAEARTLPFSSTHLRSSKIFATLGVICKCCDNRQGENGECSISWKGSCSDVQCLPWRTGKQHPLPKAS
ncbi:unnamed protein product [Linum tenue]|uniref:Uncharacterized protein n=1 Tax=Linum tenue TaxID=586396 RepID=A0AAV0PJB0_9ROSI|nr:unnamed protein product [Linum tenue]